MMRTKVTSPTKEAFSSVGNLLSRNGVSVAAASNTNMTHVITSKITPKLTESLEALGATLEVTV